MIRALVFFAFLAAVALGVNWLAERPGEVVLTWQGIEYRTSLLVAIALFAAAAAVVIVIWTLLRLVFRLPATWRAQAKASRRRRGLLALTRGIVAVGAGDSRNASRHADEAGKLLTDEPLTLFLNAQAAQLAGDRAGAEASFRQMLDVPETRLLGLRGLHIEAQRRGDAEAAYGFAVEAQALAPLPWAGLAALEHHAAQQDWPAALAAVERNAAGKIIDKATATRQRAVLKTALALEKLEREPQAALALARDAVRLAPDLVPAAVLAGQLMARYGDVRRAARLIETTWKLGPHPDLADAYLNVRSGDSARDRLLRAQKLGDIALEHPESHLVIARAAIDARDFDLARKIMAPLFLPDSPYGRATVRACLLAADLEETAGSPGRAREWLTRASRAAHDPMWIADGVISDRWAPVSPVTGRLDAFVWQRPSERLTGPPPAPFPVVMESGIDAAPAPEPPLIEPPESPAAPIALDAPEERQPDAAPSPAEPPPGAMPPLQLVGRAAVPPDGAGPETPGPPRPGRAVIFPLPTAPDDPGPDLRSSIRRV